MRKSLPVPPEITQPLGASRVSCRGTPAGGARCSAEPRDGRGPVGARHGTARAAGVRAHAGSAGPRRAAELRAGRAQSARGQPWRAGTAAARHGTVRHCTARPGPRHGGGARRGLREPPAVAKGGGRREAGRGQQEAGHGAAGGRQGAAGNGRAPRPSKPPPRDASVSVRTREGGGPGRALSPRARWREGERRGLRCRAPGRAFCGERSVRRERGRERCPARFAWPALRPLRIPRVP